MESFRENLAQALGTVPKKDPQMLHPLVLAYVGDTIFDLAVRTLLIDTHDAKAHTLHEMSARRVRASAQAQAGAALYELLNEQEQAVYRRGRNARPGTVPRHASVEEYCSASALEAVLGYLYLSGQQERLLWALQKALELEQITDSSSPRPYKG